MKIKIWYPETIVGEENIPKARKKNPRKTA